MPNDPMTTIPDRPTPSTASYILATFIVAACAGYFLGQASSIGLFSSKPKPSSSSSSGKSKSKSKSKSSWPNSYDVTVHPDSSDEELMTHLQGGKRRIKDSEDDESGSESESGSGSEESDLEAEKDPAQEQGGLKSFDDNREECKLVLVVRTDLGMSKGKIAAQCAHATLACYTHLLARAPGSPLLRRWEATGQAKIALQVGGAEQVELLRRKAVGAGLCARVVCDAGRTQVARGSVTVLGVGPGPRGVVDGVTGGLRLL